MADMILDEPAWDSDEYDLSDEQTDVLQELPPLKNRDERDKLDTAGSKAALSSTGLGSSSMHRLSGHSTSTRTFFSAKTSYPLSNFGNSDASAYGTSYFSSSPFSLALSKENASNIPARPQPSSRMAMTLGTSHYMATLESKGLLPSVATELNWSGRKPGLGQHIEFEPHEPIPLEVQGLIGSSATAKVEKVQCKRILLARKSMTCNVRLRLPEARSEIEHLHKMRHAHIVQLVGSYVQGRTFAILLYPAADWNLKDFLRRLEHFLVPRRPMDYGDFMAVASLGSFFRCLASALAHIHENTTKHLDIKPQNILVKLCRENRFGHQVYIADFGVSRSFVSLDNNQTLIPMTPKYCAPEIQTNELRGRRADVFSLGCVFLEMLTVLCRRSLEDLEDFLVAETHSKSFHANLPRAVEWLESLRRDRSVFVGSSDAAIRDVFAKYPIEGVDEAECSVSTQHIGLCALIGGMLDRNPAMRPTATGLVRLLGKNQCCDRGREAFQSETASRRQQIDSSKELALLFRRQGSERASERESTFRYIIESGECELTKSFLEGYKECLNEPSAASVSLGLRVAFRNNDFTLVELLLPLIGSYWLLKDVLPDAINHIDGPRLEWLLCNYEGSKEMAKEQFQPALGEAVTSGKFDIAKVFLQQGFSANSNGADGDHILKSAVMHADDKMVKLLLRYGAKPEQCGLAFAIVAHYEVIVNALLIAGADILAREFSPSSPPETLKPFLKNWPSDGQSPLAAAVRSRNKALLQRLLAFSSNDESLAQAINEDALLSLTVTLGECEMAELLLRKGADPRISVLSKEQPGRTVLHDIASLADNERDRWLNFARALITSCDCRKAEALQPQRNAEGKRLKKTPLQILNSNSESWIKLLSV